MHHHFIATFFVACMSMLTLWGCSAPNALHAIVPPTLERDASIPRIRLNNYVFHSEQFGESGKPVLIVLHGGPGADYRYLLGLQALSDAFQVVFYDQRGTGLSPRVPAKDITVQTFVDDLDAFVDAFGNGRKVNLLGHSWGAMLASTYVGQHPDKVRAVVMAEPAFLEPSTADIFTNSGMPSWRQITGLSAAWLGKWFVSNKDDPYARDDWFLLQALPLMQDPTELCAGGLPALQAWRFGSPNFEATVGRMMDDPEFAKSLDFRKGVEDFEGAVLFLTGQCNQLDGEKHQRRHLHYFHNATLTSIPDAGHFMFNDQPERSIAEIRAFLEQTNIR